jgi:RNA polymerase sigma factor (sigma-70 family)
MKFNNATVEDISTHRLRDEFLAGDESAYSTIYKLYAKDLYAFGLSLHAKTELIEDALHDVFIEIYTHRQNLEKVDNLKFYFFAAFRNRLFFLLKKESNSFEITEKDLQGIEERNVQEIWIENEEEIERKIFVKKLFSELTKNQQEVLYHRFVEGYSCAEIATLMNINYQSVKNLIHRSIKKLKSVTIYSVIFFILFCFL